MTKSSGYGSYSYGYGAVSRLLSAKLDANGQTTAYTYNDTTNQLTQISYADGKTVNFTYDRLGNLETYSDGTTSATYTYDVLNRKIAETVNYPGFSKTFRYQYYANGQKQSFTLPGGPTYSYAYTDNNELQNIRIPGVGNITYPSYTVGRPDSVTFPGGLQQMFQYDTLLRLQHITASNLNYGYTYDNVSNILTKSTEHGSYTYGYDDVSRLLSADNPSLDDEAWAYDGVGNRQSASGITIGDITHNENNELTLYGEIAYGYDANGNLIHKQVGTAATNFTYNAANRLVKVEDELSSTIIAEYGYDPFGRRLWKEVAGTRTYFLYADEGLVAEYDANGNELRSYGYEPDSTWGTNPLWLKQDGQYYWYQNDHLGTPQKLVDNSGTVVWDARYDAFGKAQVLVETIENNLRFPGQYYDAETGLHYNWHRYYEPTSGRYTQADPLGVTYGEENLYLYVQNNPVMYVDFGGLCCIKQSISSQNGQLFNCSWGSLKRHKFDKGPACTICWKVRCPSDHPVLTYRYTDHNEYLKDVKGLTLKAEEGFEPKSGDDKFPDMWQTREPRGSAYNVCIAVSTTAAIFSYDDVENHLILEYECCDDQKECDPSS